MFIDNSLKKDILSLEQGIKAFLSQDNATKLQVENFLRLFEKTRYNILEQIKIDNTFVEYDYERIKTVDDGYKVELRNDMLKIYIPEVMPSYKNLKTHTCKRIMENIAEITKPFAGRFKEKEIFIYAKVFDKIFGWDIDNKNIKPVADALILSKVIEDDNISKMFYAAKGEYSEIPHTEIYVLEGKKVCEFLEGCLF